MYTNIQPPDAPTPPPHEPVEINPFSMDRDMADFRPQPVPAEEVPIAYPKGYFAPESVDSSGPAPIDELEPDPTDLKKIEDEEAAAAKAAATPPSEDDDFPQSTTPSKPAAPAVPAKTASAAKASTPPKASGSSLLDS